MADVENTGEMESQTEFKNRKTGLVLSGVFLLALGGLCILIFIFSILGAILSQSAGNNTTPLSSMIIGISYYAISAVVLIWLGVGSINAKRWARALILIGSYLTLIFGLFVLLLFAKIMPDMFEQMAQSNQADPKVMAIIQMVLLIFFLFFMILVPSIFILFYRSKNVKATCEYLDPQERWTDKSPLPVLALSIMLTFASLSMFTTITYGGVLPLFGFFLSGISGTIFIIALSGLLGYLAWSLYHLNLKAWWGTFGLTIIGTLSYIVTFSTNPQGFMVMYEKMNLPPEQLSMIKQMKFLQDSSFIIFMGLTSILFIGYLFYVRRYFYVHENGSIFLTKTIQIL